MNEYTNKAKINISLKRGLTSRSQTEEGALEIPLSLSLYTSLEFASPHLIPHRYENPTTSINNTSLQMKTLSSAIHENRTKWKYYTNNVWYLFKIQSEPTNSITFTNNIINSYRQSGRLLIMRKQIAFRQCRALIRRVWLQWQNHTTL